MNLNKKGIAFEWLYILIILFFMGLVFIIFNQVLEHHIYTTTETLVPDNFENKTDIIEQNDKWMTYWLAMPIVIFGLTIIYLIVKGVSSNNQY